VNVVERLTAAGLRPGRPVALVVLPATGVALAWDGGQEWLATAHPAEAVLELTAIDPRWTWWSARETAAPLVDAGVRLRTCWDLGAVGRLLGGLRRDDPAAVWAAAHDLPEPATAGPSLDLFDLDLESDTGDDDPVRADGQLSRDWLTGRWSTDASSAQRWATLVLALQGRQNTLLHAVPDPRARPGATPLAVLTARSESTAALLAVELEHDGLPIDRPAATELLTGTIGRRPTGAAEEAAIRVERDQAVLSRFPGPAVDLRSPAQVKTLLSRIGLDLPDTRSWRLEPHEETLEPVAALLAWRKAERVATTYGWTWLDRQVGPDGRLRGAWSAADAAAGRMTAQAGLHNLPATFRPVVRAEAGHVLLRADLGQIEPRVLAVVSGDPALTDAAREDDMYAPVAAALSCDRPTAKVAVLAAMYGQTSGAAGAALRDMDRTYPAAMAYLRNAEQAGVRGTDLRTYGGRRLQLMHALAGSFEPDDRPAIAAHGRYARNAVVQGAAAELFKAWAGTVRDGLVALDGQIVLCLHDELLVHVPTDRADAARTLLVDSLDSTARWWAAGSAVRFVAEIGIGASWADAH
jgi:DNA polymerase-1